MIEYLLELAENNAIEEMKAQIEKGVDLNAKDEFGYSPLHTAIAYKNVEMALLLLEFGANGATQDNEGFTPLHYLFEHFTPEIPAVLDQILRLFPGSIKIENEHKNQPLWTAVHNGEVPLGIIEQLLKKGADKNHKNKHGRSPQDTVDDFRIEEITNLFEKY